MKIPSNKSNKLALIYGILLGDGCLSKVRDKFYFISMVGNIHDDLEFFEKIVVPCLKHFTKNTTKIKRRVKEGTIEILFTDKELFSLLSGIGFPVGKKGTKLFIPAAFNSSLKYIIQGYFATDGCLVITNNNGTLYPRIEFSSISKQLLSQVLKYLLSIGMKGKIYVSHKYPNKSWNTLYRIQFNGKTNLEVFREKIGFINPKHQRKYEKWKKGAAGDI